MSAHKPNNVNPTFPTLDWHQAWDATSNKAEWMCKPLLERGRLVALYSPAKAGKSLLTLEIAAALATGRPALGNRQQPPLTVLYADAENGQGDIIERLKAMGYEPHDLNQLRYMSFPNLAALDSPTGGRQLLQAAHDYAADLVILDTISRFVDGNENESTTYHHLYRHALVHLKSEGITVLRLDHSGQDVNRGQRGSTAKYSDVDDVWALSVKADIVTLEREVTRHGHGESSVTLKRLGSPLRHHRTDPVEAFLTEAQKITQLVDAMDALGLDKRLGRDPLSIALRDAGVNPGRSVVFSKAVKAWKAVP